MGSSRACGVDDAEEVARQLAEVCKSRLTICGSRFWDHSVFDGMMLSDGHLSCQGRNARFRLACKHEEFAQKFKTSSGSFPWTEPRCKQVYDKRTQKTYSSWRLDSLVDERLTEEWKRWYVNGKKTVPRDVSLDAVTLTWWYLGDGHLCRKKSRPQHRRVILATQGFLDEDIEFLESKLREMLGDEGVYIENRNIVIGRQALCEFVKIVGLKSPVECYQYKFEFGPYVDSGYWSKSFMGSRNPSGRPRGVKEKTKRKRRTDATKEAA